MRNHPPPFSPPAEKGDYTSWTEIKGITHASNPLFEKPLEMYPSVLKEAR